MIKRHIQNLAEQLARKKHGSRLDDIQKIMAAGHDSIQARAYQIYQEKGGSALDNWLEAERDLGTEN